MLRKLLFVELTAVAFLGEGQAKADEPFRDCTYGQIAPVKQQHYTFRLPDTQYRGKTRVLRPGQFDIPYSAYAGRRADLAGVGSTTNGGIRFNTPDLLIDKRTNRGFQPSY